MVPGTVHPTFDGPTKTSLAAQSPRLTKNSKTIMASPSGPLSQSAPSLALLDPSFLLQVQANIRNSKCYEMNICTDKI